jgi:hypothetical protein
MTNIWHCYAWRGPADTPRGDEAPTEDWTSPEGAIEFLRRELSSHGLYSKDALTSALLDMRKGQPVALSRKLDDGNHLHLEVVPEAG